jgi:hypothetical protein
MRWIFMKGFVAMKFAEPAASPHALQRRVKRLLHLDQSEPDHSELRRAILPFLRSLGSVALIGGAIRDVARAGKRAFSSDLDFVVYDGDRREFISQMQRCGGIANRFGGFALNHFSVKVDLWHIEDTWARTAGYVSVQEPADLIRCTFFDWDSVIFDIRSGRLILPSNYFEKITHNVMDIQLEQNPNPMGSLVRALRRAGLWNVRFGPRLTAFTRRHLSEMSWPELVALDERAFKRPVLKYLARDRLLERLSSPTRTELGEATQPVPEPQIPLPLANEPVRHS